MFSSVAFAQDAAPAAAPGEPSAFAGMLPIVLMIVLFYFLLVRPQQKKANEHKKMVDALRRGDKVITTGGFYGTIHKVDEDSLSLEIAPDVRVKMDKSSVAAVVTRTEPADSPSVGEDTKAANSKAASGKQKVKAND